MLANSSIVTADASLRRSIRQFFIAVLLLGASLASWSMQQPPTTRQAFKPVLDKISPLDQQILKQYQQWQNRYHWPLAQASHALILANGREIFDLDKLEFQVMDQSYDWVFPDTPAQLAIKTVQIKAKFRHTQQWLDWLNDLNQRAWIWPLECQLSHSNQMDSRPMTGFGANQMTHALAQQQPSADPKISMQCKILWIYAERTYP